VTRHRQTPGTSGNLTALSAAIILSMIGASEQAAAESCTISDWPLGIPSGSTALVVQSMPQPRMVITTAHRSANSPAGGKAAAPPGLLKAHVFPPRPAAQNDQQRLYYAVIDNDIGRVRALLRSSAVDVNDPIQEQSRDSLLDLSARYALPDIAHALIEKGARVRADATVASAVDIHPLLSAMTWLKLLIESRGSPGVFTAAATRTPERYEAIIRILLDAGADPNELPMPPARLGPLGVLADTSPFDGDVRLAQLLLDHGASLENSLAVASALAVAAENGRADLVSLMLSAGADPNIAGNSRESLLCEAVEKINVDRMRPLVPMLLAHHANANVSCRSGAPPIVGVRDREIAAQLLDHGADPNRAGQGGATILTVLHDEDHELIDLLLQSGARLGFTDEDLSKYRQHNVSMSPITWAVLHKQDYLAARLIETKQLDSAGDCGAVVYAADNNAALTLSALFKQGANPNSTSEHGISALMAAAYHGRMEALHVLLAQPGIHVDQGTPWHFNRAAFEIKFYGEGHEPFRTGAQTALMYAASAGQAEASRLLLMHGADRDKEDAEGYSALKYVNTVAVRDAFVASTKSH
jgi:ankyrin repeat protein